MKWSLPAIRRGAADAVVPAFEHHRRDGDPRLLGDQVLEPLVARVAVGQSVTVAVGVDDDVDEVGVVQARGALAGNACRAPLQAGDQVRQSSSHRSITVCCSPRRPRSEWK